MKRLAFSLHQECLSSLSLLHLLLQYLAVTPPPVLSLLASLELQGSVIALSEDDE